MSLNRFVDAQDRVWQQVVQELRAGRKQSHWMWFVFPQIEGLGTSAMSQHYALSGLDEACAYLDHPDLGPRLLQAVTLACQSPAPDAETLFGHVDALKFRSSMTLFGLAADDPAPFMSALDRLCGGEEDPRTRQLLGL
jgi:uncharacterized protein (DUF1810 family)